MRAFLRPLISALVLAGFLTAGVYYLDQQIRHQNKPSQASAWADYLYTQVQALRVVGLHLGKEKPLKWAIHRIEQSNQKSHLFEIQTMELKKNKGIKHSSYYEAQRVLLPLFDRGLSIRVDYPNVGFMGVAKGEPEKELLAMVGGGFFLVLMLFYGLARPALDVDPRPSQPRSSSGVEDLEQGDELRVGARRVRSLLDHLKRLLQIGREVEEVHKRTQEQLGEIKNDMLSPESELQPLAKEDSAKQEALNSLDRVYERVEACEKQIHHLFLVRRTVARHVQDVHHELNQSMEAKDTQKSSLSDQQAFDKKAS